MIGLLVTALVMTRGVFPRLLGWLGVAAGVLGLAAEVLRFVLPGLYLAALLQWVWVVWTGIVLLRLGARGESAPEAGEPRSRRAEARLSTVSETSVPHRGEPRAHIPSTIQPARPVVVLLPILVVGVIHLGAILLALPDVVEWTKPLLMPALAIGLIWGAPERRSPAIVLGVLALFLSWVGDVTLRWFVVGLIFFLLAHIVYLVLFVTRLAERRVPLVGRRLRGLARRVAHDPGPAHRRAADPGRSPTASCSPRWRQSPPGATAGSPWGGALFVVSDSILAINKFLPDAGIPLADFLIMVTYIAAQTLIVWGLLRHERARWWPAVTSRS